MHVSLSSIILATSQETDVLTSELFGKHRKAGNGGHRARFLSYKHLKLKLRVLLTGFTVAMVTYYVKKVIITVPAIIIISTNVGH